MNAINFDAQVDDDKRRRGLYAGQLFVYSPTPGGVALCEHAREMIEEAFAPHDPPEAQHHMEVDDYAAILKELKPKFIHHPRSKELMQAYLAEMGCDLERTYLDVPRMRSATSDGYLTSGIAYALHPHRDTWYSAPMAQLTWWLPIYEVEPDNVMAFHPRYWSEPVENSSGDYNYYEWNATGRKDAAKHVKKDTRNQPKPNQALDPNPQIRIVGRPGGAIIFSSAHMHSTVPNTSGRTRFSIDFRTVNRDDLEARRGAPNLDAACTGTNLRDYLRGTDLTHLPEELVAAYDDETLERGQAVFQPA